MSRWFFESKGIFVFQRKILFSSFPFVGAKTRQVNNNSTLFSRKRKDSNVLGENPLELHFVHLSWSIFISSFPIIYSIFSSSFPKWHIGTFRGPHPFCCRWERHCHPKPFPGIVSQFLGFFVERIFWGCEGCCGEFDAVVWGCFLTTTRKMPSFSSLSFGFLYQKVVRNNVLFSFVYNVLFITLF